MEENLSESEKSLNQETAMDETARSQEEANSIEDKTHKKPSSNESIQIHIREITEMIAFLDYSFERAFTIKEKSYIRAYKDHVLKI